MVLIEHGATLTLKADNLRTPLHIATLRHFDEFSELVLTHYSHLIDIDSQDNEGQTILMNAVKLGNKKIVMLCLKANANVWIVNNEGQSALDKAIEIGNDEIAEVLANVGAAKRRGVLK